MKYAAILAALLSGCSATHQYQQSAIPAAGDYHVCVRVTLTATEQQATGICAEHYGPKGLAGCYLTPIIEKWTPRIVAPRPTSFNDAATLQTIGHEFVHAIGGRHE